MLRFNFLLSFIVLGFFSACTDSGDGPTKPGVNKTPNEPQCTVHYQCEAGLCQNGKCLKAKSCKHYKDCDKSAAICSESRCLPHCNSDNDCGLKDACINGLCEPFDKSPWEGEEIHPKDAKRGEFQYGYVEGRMDFPLGISMAGYGGRNGIITPFQESLKGSGGAYDFPNVKATVLDNGKVQLVLLRLPFSWSTDFMHASISRILTEKTGKRYINNLVISTTHSHSYPARYWYIAPEMPFGFLGYGTFSKFFFEKMMASIAKITLKAIDNLKPGKFAYTVIDPFDPESKISADRRKENEKLPAPYRKAKAIDDKDNRLVAWFLAEKNSDKPEVGFINFGMHGTHLNTKFLSGDAPAGVEWAIGREFSQKLGNNFRAVYLAGNGGDISPQGNDTGHNKVGACQVVGYRLSKVLFPKLKDLKFSSDVSLSIGDVRFAVSRKDIGYSPDQFYNEINGKKTVYDLGGGLCVQDAKKDGSPHKDGEINCLADIKNLRKKQYSPLVQFSKSRVTAFKINDLLAVTLPGEPVSRLGRKISKTLKDKLSTNVVYTLGYAQDHHFYLIHEEDWFYGGYEARSNIWGYKFGEYLEKMALKAGELASKEEGVQVDWQQIKPTWWKKFPELESKVHKPIKAKNTIAFVKQPEKQVYHQMPQQFSIHGGDPFYGLPSVSLEVKENGNWKSLMWPGKRPYDDEGFEITTVYEGDFNGLNLWNFSWRENIDFPGGIYRFKVSGKSFDGQKTSSYSLPSDEFQLKDLDNLPIWLKLSEKKDFLYVVSGYFSKNSIKNPDQTHFVLFPETGPDHPAILIEGSMEISISDDQGKVALEEKGKLAQIDSQSKLVIEAKCQSIKDCPSKSQEISLNKLSTYAVKPKGALGQGKNWNIEVKIKDKFGHSGKLSLKKFKW